MQAYRVTCAWGDAEEGTYCDYVWAENVEEAMRACWQLMNDEDRADNPDTPLTEYDVLEVSTVADAIKEAEFEILVMRDFVAKGA